jgi:hypothetical protein
MLQSNPFFDAFSQSGYVRELLLLSAAVLLAVTLFLRPALGRRKALTKRRWQANASRQPFAFVKPAAWPKADLSLPAAQLEAIAKVDFECVKLLNREEARLLPVLEAATRECGDGHRLMAQTSLGELVRPRKTSGNEEQHQNAFAAINSKRLDFAIIDRFGRLVAAVEFQGSGHYGDPRTFMRDSVKREVLRKAGVSFMEATPDTTRDDLRRFVCQSVSVSRAD